jgi:hypothetical protein
MTTMSDIRRRQRARNWALLVVLVGVVALFYLMALARMGAFQ